MAEVFFIPHNPMKQVIIAVALLLLSVKVLAQQGTNGSQKKDTIKYDFLVVDSRFQNQFSFWGRNYGLRLPFLSTSLMYYFHSGIWVSTSNFQFFNRDIPSQLGLTLGYFKSLSAKVDWHSSYTQFYVAGSSIPSTNRTQGYLQTTIGADWGVLFSSFQAHVLLNQNSDIFFPTQHSRYFQFNKPLLKKIQVSFEPKASFTFGTHNFEYANGLVVAPGGGGVVSQGNTDLTLGCKIQALNFDFTFPIKFAIGNFSIEPSWRYTLPFNANPTLGANGLSIWAIGANYSIPLKRKVSFN